MADKVVFEFSLSMHNTVPLPDLRIFVDKNRDGNIADSEELSLSNQDLKWTGEFSPEGDQVKGTLFLVLYRGSKGATWRLKAKQGDKSLYEKSNTVKSPTNSIVGALGV